MPTPDSSTGVPLRDLLLATKLYVPPPRPNQAHGDSKKALTALARAMAFARAMALAEPTGYVRTFVAGTVKTHVHNIYGKLGAQSRAQALARARELNLL